MNNQTTATPFLTLGIPEKVVINGEQITHPTAVNAYLKAINENPTFIRAIAISIINGVVKVYVKTVDGGITVPVQSEALKHALKIHELKNNILEIARCEKRDISTFTARELVSAADNLLDIMQDFDNDAYTRGQRKRLQNFVAKWRSEAGNI